MKSPYLSIIIPAHNEEARLPVAIKKINGFTKTKKYQVEIIIVENGSQDKTLKVANIYAKKFNNIKVLSVGTRGKGLAVKAGMLKARGKYRFIADADLSMPIEEIDKFLPPNGEDYDLNIGTREGPKANRIGEPWHRHFIGRVLNMIIKLTAVRGIEDTQTGFKMFTSDAAKDLFSVQQMSGIGFDVELIFIAKKRGYSIREVPITWYFDPDSRMKLIQDSLHILVEIFQIRKNWMKGVYKKV